MNEPIDSAQGSQLDRMEKKLAELEGAVNATYRSVERMRKYFFWTGVITIGVIVVPLLLIPLFLPAFFASQGVGLSGF
jgi:hypothetical protein